VYLFVKVVAEFGLSDHLAGVSICDGESARPMLRVLTIAVPTVAVEVSGVEGVRTGSQRDRLHTSLLRMVPAVLRQLSARP
jgi:hypothetical protein